MDRNGRTWFLGLLRARRVTRYQRAYVGVLCLSMICLVSSSHAADLPWENLPFTFRPLVQREGEDLFPPLDRVPADWTFTGDVSVVRRNGKPALRFGPKTDDAPRSIATSKRIPVRPGVLYRLRFVAHCAQEPGGETRRFPGLLGYLSMRDKEGKKLNDLSPAIRSVPLPGGPDTVERLVFTPRGVDHAILYLRFYASTGEAFVYDFDLREAEAGESESRRILSTPEGAHFAEAPRHPEPRAPKETTVFVRDNPDELFFYSHPLPEEVGRPVHLSATPGEMAVGTVAVFAADPLTSLRAIVPELRAKAGIMPADSTQCRAVHYLPRRTTGTTTAVATGQTAPGFLFHWVPDFFLDRPAGVDVAVGKTQVFWLTIRVPREAKAGDYSGILRMAAAGFEAQVPVRLTVRDFQLADPADVTWGLYADRAFRKADPEARLATARDIKAHGIDCMVSGIEPAGRIVWDNGRVVGYELDSTMVSAVKAAREAGMRGPFCLWMGQLERQVAKHFDRPAADAWKQPNCTEAFRSVLHLFKQEWDKRGWGVLGYVAKDEPSRWHEGDQARIAWECACAEAAGIGVYCTSSHTPAEPLGQGLTYHCYQWGVLWAPRHAAFTPWWFQRAQATRAAGQKVWYYASGCYGGDIGNVGMNRFAVGFLFYRSGADGVASWTYQRPDGNAFNDFAPRRAGDARSQWCITLPDPEHSGRDLDTPQWEGLRQGWLDYRYALTLARTIEAAKTDPARKAKAEGVERSFNKMWETSGWGEPMTRALNANCDSWRRRIADWISALQPIPEIAPASSRPQEEPATGSLLLDPKIRGSASVDLSSLGSIVRDVIKPGMNDREKTIALFHFIRKYTYSRHYPTEFGGSAREHPIKYFNMYPWGQCGTYQMIIAEVFTAAGIPARKRVLPASGGHWVTEVYYGGGWHYIDDSIGFYFCKRDKKTIASLDDLVADPSLITNPSTREGLLWPVPDSYLVKYAKQMTDEPLRPEKSRSDKKGLHVPIGKYHSMRIDLGRGDEYILSCEKEGETGVWFYPKEPVNAWILGKNKWHRCPMPGPGPFPWPDRKVNINWKFEGFSNSKLVYTPDFNDGSYTDRVVAKTNMKSYSEDGLKPCLHPETAGKPGSVVFEICTPYVMVAGSVQGILTRKHGHDVLKMAVSRDEGKTWTDVAVPEQTGAVQSNMDITDPIYGAYTYWIRFECFAKQKTTDAGLDDLTITTILQSSPSSVPRLAQGGNTITVTVQNPDMLKKNKVYVEYCWKEKDSSTGTVMERKDKQQVTASPTRYKIICRGQEPVTRYVKMMVR